MKTFKFQMTRLTIAASAVLASTIGNALAQDTTATTTTDAAQPVVSQPAPQLSYGVPEVLQLSQAKVGESTIVNYIHNSGNNYGLNAAQIIYLRQQGVSDNVINAMLNQRSLNAQIASTAAASQTSDSSTYSTPASTPAQSTVTYVQAVPSSSVVVVPDTQTYYYNNWLYYHSPYYSYYPAYSYCWPAPAVSVSFIGGRGWVGYRGGWHGGGSFHGGWHGGGGWHSGGWHR